VVGTRRSCKTATRGQHDRAQARLATTESSGRLAGAGDPARQAGHAATLDTVDAYLVRESFPRLMADSQLAMEYLYGRLFAAHPALRALFPLSMTATRNAVFRMLAELVGGLEDRGRTRGTLAAIAAGHRKFGVMPRHYQPFFDALLATARELLGPGWTPEASRAWHGVASYCIAVMTEAAEAAEIAEPAWWTAEIVQHDRRADSIAVLSIRPDQPLEYQPGQYISVQTSRWPRVWRSYSVANAPRENGLLDIHVRAVPGGLVSTALVAHCAAGDTLTLGPARGGMRVDAGCDRDLVCVAGGTGLAPVKAITEAVVGAARHGRRRAVTLYVGVRRSRELYDMRDLETLRLAYPSLTLIPVVEREIDYVGRVGRLPDVVALHPSFRDCDVYVAGPARMIAATAAVLSSRVPAGRLHHDPIEAMEGARPPKVDFLADGG